MKFERRDLTEIEGAILAHNISDANGTRILRKGTRLSSGDIIALKELGRESVYIAELEPGDVGEADAARMSAELIRGDNIRLVGAVTGRTNLLAETMGMLQIDVDRLDRLNAVSGFTISTLHDRSVVPERQMVASIKIIPYGISSEEMQSIREITGSEPVVSIRTLPSRRVHLMLLGGAPILDRLESDFRGPLGDRVSALGSNLIAIHRVATDGEDPVQEILHGLEALRVEPPDLLIMAGETAIMDPRDVIPTAVELAGGEVTVTGAPVDPGNLLMIAYLDNVPILGAPGCARSPQENVVDWILPRLLSGERLQHADITSMGHGGLLQEIKERPSPRSMARSENDA